MRYAQAQSLPSVSGLKNVGMAACYDLGDRDPTNAMGLCHSRYKQQCGKRLALALREFLPPPLGTGTNREVNYTSDCARSCCSCCLRLIPHLQYIGPSIVNVSLVNKGTLIAITVKNGAGLHWNGTTQCSACCGLAPAASFVPPLPRGAKAPCLGGARGELADATKCGTNSASVMRMLTQKSGSWEYVSPGGVTFPNANTSGQKHWPAHTILVPGPRWLDKSGKPYFAAEALTYAWEDFPQCAIYNAAGIPLPPFNLSLVQTDTDGKEGELLNWREPLATRGQLLAEIAVLKAQLLKSDDLAAAAAEAPCDIYAKAGTPCAAAHAMTRAMYSGFTGKMYQLTITASNRTLDVHALASGHADVVAHDAFCGAKEDAAPAPACCSCPTHPAPCFPPTLASCECACSCCWRCCCWRCCYRRCWRCCC